MGAAATDAYSKLRRARLRATLILLAVAAGYLGAPFLPIGEFWMRAIQSACEAGTVGGLADWFAVTALFRRPLGLPIPHTALIPSRKSQIGSSIAHFVEEYFVHETLLIALVRKDDRALQIGGWLSSEVTSRIIARSICSTLRTLTRNGVHLDVIDTLVPLLKTFRRSLHGELEESIAKITGRFVPSAIDRIVTARIAKELDRLIENLGTKDSQDRVNLDAWLRLRLENMPDSWRAPIAKVAKEVKSFDSIRSFGGGSPPRELVDAIAELIRRLGQSISTSTEGRRWINTAIERGVIQYIAPFRSQITGYIENVVGGWDAAKITSALELQVGKDLQYVRINGTLIGALIGIGLFTIGSFLHLR